ncbi:uncharacterized protein LOC110453673, partial [Mizuhopecten yessoensis]|uniref:uncharacterized protein LOC110453673 n=1 Tax=Mizuhopecten yessoensis TaxID=6573 RepID=UPI000B45B772
MRVDSSEVRYTEGSSLELRVDVDSSPDADVTLLRSQTKVAVGTGKYDIKLDNLQCNHTGTYDVRATNFVTQNRSNADPSRRQFELQVSCVPRRYGGVNAVIGVAGKKGQTVVLNVTVIANPTPTIQWSEGLKTPDVTKNNAYMYTIRGKVTVTTWSDLLKYHVNVTNTVPGLLTVPFEIRPE